MNSVILADVVTAPTASLSTWFVAMLFTLALELSIVALIWRFTGRLGSLLIWTAAGVAGNVVSHPVATFLWNEMPELSRGEQMLAFAILEVAVTLFEAWVYQRIVKCPAQLALLFSAIANGVTGAIAVYLVFVR